MRNRLLLSYGALVLVVLVVLGVPLGATFARAERRELEQRVQHDALSLALLSAQELQDRRYPPLRSLAADYTARTKARVVITDANGLSVADSEETRLPLGRDFSTRPEVAAALRGAESVGTRASTTLGTELLYVAEPVATGGRIHGTVRVTYPTSFVQARIRRVWTLLAATGLLILGFAMLLATVLAQTLSAPLRALAGTARQLGAGDLTARADSTASLPEVAVLADVLNDTAGKLDALISRQREFVSHASHQLRSPLAALRLRLENLEDDLDGAPAESVAASLREVQRLSRLVDGLLALARLDEMSAAPETIGLTELVAERLQVWEPYAAERSVTLALEADRPVAAVATVGHLEQVLDNLISNALEVSPAGGRLILRVTDPGWFAEVHVLDEGPGLSEEDRARAFDRFWRAADGSGSKSGSGLGLAIVQRLVTADGGEVALQAAPGGGLDAVVRLRRSERAVAGRRFDLPAQPHP
jgi:signal transduction histidine kinase